MSNIERTRRGIHASPKLAGSTVIEGRCSRAPRIVACTPLTSPAVEEGEAVRFHLASLFNSFQYRGQGMAPIFGLATRSVAAASQGPRSLARRQRQSGRSPACSRPEVRIWSTSYSGERAVGRGYVGCRKTRQARPKTRIQAQVVRIVR